MAKKCKRVRVDINTSRRGRGGIRRSFMAQRGEGCTPRWKHPTPAQRKQRSEFKAAAKKCNRTSRKPGVARSRCMAAALK
jgi:hypothetical protein